LVEQKAVFERGKPKHRYLAIFAPNRRIKRAILQALRWKTLPYSKRKVAGRLATVASLPAYGFSTLPNDERHNG
jgi:hypothetical protein